MPPHGARHVESPRQVDRDDAVPHVVRFVGEVARPAPAGVVEEDVHAPPSVHDSLDGGVHPRAVGDVALDENRLAAVRVHGVPNRLALPFAPRHNRHLRALPRETADSRLSDSAIATGDNRHLAVQSAGHVNLLLILSVADMTTKGDYSAKRAYAYIWA